MGAFIFISLLFSAYLFFLIHMWWKTQKVLVEWGLWEYDGDET